MSTRETQRVLAGYLLDHHSHWLAEAVEFHDVSQPDAMRGRTEVAAWLAAFYTGAFADAHIEVVSLLAGDDEAAAEWVFHGTHTGSLAGERPTGRPVRLPMCAIYQVANGEIVRARVYYDTTSLRRQLEPSLAPERPG